MLNKKHLQNLVEDAAETENKEILVVLSSVEHALLVAAYSINKVEPVESVLIETFGEECFHSYLIDGIYVHVLIAD